MMIHHLKHFLSEILALGALIVPVAVALAGLIGVASWIIGGQESGLRASWITWCATMGVVPIFLRLSCGPDTRMICDRCITALKRRLHHSHRRGVQYKRSDAGMLAIESISLRRFPMTVPVGLE